MPVLALAWQAGLCSGDSLSPFSRRHYLGTEILKTVVTVQGLFVKEYPVLMPEILYKKELNSFLNLNTAGGYVRTHMYPVYQNLDYHSEGGYLKVGIGGRINRFLWVDWNLLYTGFREWGEFIVDGAYFGDLRIPFQRRMVQGIGFETAPNLHIRWSSWHFLFGITYTVLTTTADRAEVPPVQIPGAGLLPLVNRRHWYGFQLQVLYSFRLRQGDAAG